MVQNNVTGICDLTSRRNKRSRGAAVLSDAAVFTWMVDGYCVLRPRFPCVGLWGVVTHQLWQTKARPGKETECEELPCFVMEAEIHVVVITNASFLQLLLGSLNKVQAVCMDVITRLIASSTSIPPIFCPWELLRQNTECEFAMPSCLPGVTRVALSLTALQAITTFGKK